MAYNHEPSAPCLLHVKGKWDVLYPIIGNTDKHTLLESDNDKSSNNKSKESVHPPHLTPPTRGGGKTFPPPRWGRSGGGAERLQPKNDKPEDAAEKYYDDVLKRISEFNRDIMKNCKDEDKLKKSMSYVMPESEQEKLSPGLRKILACYGYYENKYYDYRALAEGLRVQFFWKLMHSKENTYDHYLRKYRGEMDWIFQTVRNDRTRQGSAH